MAAVRLHTFERGEFRLWADRVSVLHGRASLYTLWRRDDRGNWQRLIGGVLLRKLRHYLRNLG